MSKLVFMLLMAFSFGSVEARAAQNRDQVNRATKALIKGSRFIRDNREEAVKILIAWGKAKPEHAYAAYDPL